MTSPMDSLMANLDRAEAIAKHLGTILDREHDAMGRLEERNNFLEAEVARLASLLETRSAPPKKSEPVERILTNHQQLPLPDGEWFEIMHTIRARSASEAMEVVYTRNTTEGVWGPMSVRRVPQ